MKTRKHVYVQTLLCGVLMAAGTLASTAMAADAPPQQTNEQGKTTPTPPTKEQREKMAQAHEKLAACLRSDRAIKECRQEVIKACQDAGNECMMRMDHMRHGMGGAHADGNK
jgi:hypothetical protein